jgi:hypothetical protein
MGELVIVELGPSAMQAETPLKYTGLDLAGVYNQRDDMLKQNWINVMKVKAQVNEVVVVSREIEVDVPEGTQMEDSLVLDTIVAALYTPAITAPDSPWKVHYDQGPTISILHEKCMQVEFDHTYWGGDYDKCGDFAYVPLRVIDAIEFDTQDIRWDVDDIKVRMAFQQVTGVHPLHIVHFCPDEVYDQYGNDWQEAWEESGCQLMGS